jgi:hypothetical protein
VPGNVTFSPFPSVRLPETGTPRRVTGSPRAGPSGVGGPAAAGEVDAEEADSTAEGGEPAGHSRTQRLQVHVPGGSGGRARQTGDRISGGVVVTPPRVGCAALKFSM